MARKSAISKSMRRKKQVTTKKGSSGGGGLSKKDRTYMKEFGFLNFEDQEDEENEDDRSERLTELESRLGTRTIYLDDDSVHPSELKKKNKPFLTSTSTPVSSSSSSSLTSIETSLNESEWVNESENKPSLMTVDPLSKLLTTMSEKRKRQLIQKFKRKKEKQIQKQSGSTAWMSTKASLVNEHFPKMDLDSEEKAASSINEEELSDPEENESKYHSHFNNDTEKNQHLQDLVQKCNGKTLKWNSIPLSETITLSSILPTTELNEITEKFKTLVSTPPSSSAFTFAEKRIKPRLWTRYLASLPSTSSTPFSPLLSHLFPMISSYHDVLYTSPRYLSEASTLQSLYVLHALNHVYTSRKQVWKGSLKLQASKPATKTTATTTTTTKTKTKTTTTKKDAFIKTSTSTNLTSSSSSTSNATELLEIRDQGFTRPTVLMLFPFRNMAYDAVHTLLKYSGTSADTLDAHQMQRFEDEFGGEPHLNSKKPLDFQQVFRTNIDDCFRLGIQLTKKTLKLYTPFNHSDFLIASPLGLRTLIDTEKDHDYLSSMECVIVDGAHIMNMQNWEHVVFLMKLLNKIPKKPGECDFSRVKPYFLENLSKYFRQTLIFSEYVFPDVLNLFHSQSLNLVSGLRFQFRTPTQLGTMLQTSLSLPHTFIKLSTDYLQADDTRFDYFVNTLLPTFRSSSSSSSSSSVSLHHQHRLIFFPSYFEYVRVRNYMDQHEYEFEVASEYSSQSELMRSRTLFQHHRTPVLLYTERLHFFKRLVIHGCLHLVFYGVPENSHFYSELIQWILHMKSYLSHGSITTLFTKWDAMKLERIVGKDKMKEMLEQPGPFVYQKV